MTETIYAIGDIHGCKGFLDRMLTEITARKPGTIVTLGDYIDRGPDSKCVLDTLMNWNNPDFPMINLMGNHEEMAIPPRSIQNWLMNGGKETIVSFNGAIPEAYWKWIARLPTEYVTDDYIFVHAGLEPGKDAYETSREIKLWVRREFLNSDYDWGKLVVHGHTPKMQVEEKPNRIDIDTAAVFEGALTCAILKGRDKPIQYIHVLTDEYSGNIGAMTTWSKLHTGT